MAATVKSGVGDESEMEDEDKRRKQKTTRTSSYTSGMFTFSYDDKNKLFHLSRLVTQIPVQAMTNVRARMMKLNMINEIFRHYTPELGLHMTSPPPGPQGRYGVLDAPNSPSKSTLRAVKPLLLLSSRTIRKNPCIAAPYLLDLCSFRASARYRCPQPLILLLIS